MQKEKHTKIQINDGPYDLQYLGGSNSNIFDVHPYLVKSSILTT